MAQLNNFNNEVALVKDFKCELTTDTLTLQDQLKLEQSIPFCVGYLQFEGIYLAKLDGCCLNENDKKILEIIRAHLFKGDDGPSRKFMSLTIKINRSTLEYTLSINNNFIQSLKSFSPVASLKLNGVIIVEEYIRDRDYWVKWEPPEEDVHFDLLKSIENVGEASPDVVQSYVVLSSRSVDYKAIKLIFQNREDIQIRINLNITFHWSTMESSVATFQLNAKQILERILEHDGPEKDIPIEIDGAAVTTCHKSILAGQSRVFNDILNPDPDESNPGVLDLSGISVNVVKILILYLKGEKILSSSLDCSEVSELLQAAHQYQIPDLEKYLSSLLLSKNDEWFTQEVILELYFFVLCLESCGPLKEHLLQIMSRICPDTVASSDDLDDLSPNAREELVDQINDILDS